MTEEWEQLKKDCAVWIPPAAMDALADAIPAAKVDTRTLLLELARRFGRGSRFGRALRVMNDYRDSATGGFHPMSSVVPVGCVRFMFEAGRPEDGEDDVERKLRQHLRPDIDASMTRWWANTRMGSFANARSAVEVRETQRAHEDAHRHSREFDAALKAGPTFESPDDSSVAEARAWLRKRNVDFATNRFHGSRRDAAAFVDALYAAGARRVVIANIHEDADDPSGKYADSMTIYLPDDTMQRNEIVRIINAVGQPDTEDGPITDTGDSSIGLWWD